MQVVKIMVSSSSFSAQSSGVGGLYSLSLDFFVLILSCEILSKEEGF